MPAIELGRVPFPPEVALAPMPIKSLQGLGIVGDCRSGLGTPG
jgi:hypothetical protein